jgi:hypothetical protein
MMKKVKKKTASAFSKAANEAAKKTGAKLIKIKYK